jgi:hypothetical protein
VSTPGPIAGIDADVKDVLLGATGTARALAAAESGSGPFVVTGRKVIYTLSWAQLQARLAA